MALAGQRGDRSRVSKWCAPGRVGSPSPLHDAISDAGGPEGDWVSSIFGRLVGCGVATKTAGSGAAGA